MFGFILGLIDFISLLGSNELYGTIYKLRTLGLGLQYRSFYIILDYLQDVTKKRTKYIRTYSVLQQIGG